MIYLLFLFLFLSAFFSGLETGFLSMDKISLKLEADKNRISKQLYFLYLNMDKVIASILIGNNLVNTALASLFTYYCTKNLALQYSSEVLSLFLAGFIVVFAESLPKIFYREYPKKMVKKSLPLFLLFYKLFYFLSFFITWVIKKADRSPHSHDEKILPYQLASILGEESNNKNRDENLIQEGLGFSVVDAKKIMTPRTEIIAIEKDKSTDDVITLAKESGFSRFPIFSETIDNIIGVLTLYDLLKEENKDIAKLMHKPYFAPESIEIDKLLLNMQNSKSVFCVLVDSYGGTSGIVTIEDILEELVGEIEDEYDSDSQVLVKQLAGECFLIYGKAEVDILNEKYSFNLPESQDYNTIAGLMLYMLEGIPRTGTKLEIGEWQLKVEESNKKAIKLIKMSKK